MRAEHSYFSSLEKVYMTYQSLEQASPLSGYRVAGEYPF